MKNQDPNTIDDLDSMLKLLTYYRASMESRRTVMIQLFITVATLFVLGIAGQNNMVQAIRETLFIWALVLTLLFGGFLYQNEKANAFVRPRYHHLEGLLWDRLVGEKVSEEKPGIRILRSWATTWPLFTLLVLVLVMWLNN